MFECVCACREIQAVEEQPAVNQSQTQTRDSQNNMAICDNAALQLQIDEFLCTKLFRVIKMSAWLGVETDRNGAKDQSIDLVVAMCNERAKAELGRLERLSLGIKNSL